MMKRPLLLSFLFGAAVFSWPAYQLLNRSPAVETTIHWEPETVVPGQRSEAVWTVKVLRPGCRGLVYRKMIDSQGRIFAFSAVEAVIHGKVGTTDTYRSDWVIPAGMSPGPATFRRDTERWCNVLQHWLWPMQEVHKAHFTVVATTP